jgi:hypothetical protein
MSMSFFWRIKFSKLGNVQMILLKKMALSTAFIGELIIDNDNIFVL